MRKFSAGVGDCHFGKKHPMKPHRVLIAHSLIVNYGLYEQMHVYRPERASAKDMTRFHSEEYIKFLLSVKNQNLSSELKSQSKKFYIGTRENDCPIFEGLYNFCQISAGASLAAAINLNKGTSDICINWAGGLHHAKKSSASGFCYVNDIVLGILELLKYNQRVLYVDIDVHHGDGVEESFYTTDRVMTVSFHRFGDDFFPGTGDSRDIGYGKGKYYSLNVPLQAGIDDTSYEMIFVPIMRKVMEVYRPSVIVLQCGADSLAGDRLGDFNLTFKGHGKCVEFMRSFNVPLMLLGGGGYTVKNVSRCWAYETAIALNEHLPEDLPNNSYFNYFKPELKLHILPDKKKKNKNSRQSLWDAIKLSTEKLKQIQSVPSVQVQEIPEDAIINENVDDDTNLDQSQTQYEQNKQVIPKNEFYDEY